MDPMENAGSELEGNANRHGFESTLTDDPKDEDCVILPSANHAKISDVLTLNLGGEKIVETLRSTLTCVPGSKLAKMFSGRWDDSLPKDKNGNFFIDYNPKLAVPFLDYLRCLSSMTFTAVHAPPITPSFEEPCDEAAFQTMVDAFALTTVFYSYELYKCAKTASIFPKRTSFSRAASVVGTHMHSSCLEGMTAFCLDRPIRAKGECHVRKIKKFELKLGDAREIGVGWVQRRCSYAKHRLIFLSLAHQHVHFVYFARGTCRKRTLKNIHFDKDSVIFCSRVAETGALEWHLNSVLVAEAYQVTTGVSVKSDNDDKVCRIGWSAPIDDDMIPFTFVIDGQCHFSSIELEL